MATVPMTDRVTDEARIARIRAKVAADSYVCTRCGWWGADKVDCNADTRFLLATIASKDEEIARLRNAINEGYPKNTCDPVELLREERRLAKSEHELLMAERDEEIAQLRAARTDRETGDE